MPLSGHLQGAAVPPFPADADAAGIVAAVPEGGGAAGADPVGASVVALGLFAQTLLEHPADLVDVQTEMGERGGVILHRVDGGAEPVLQLCGQLVEGPDVPEIFEEHLVELVKIRLGVHQHCPGELIEACQGRAVKPHRQAAQERLPLLHGHLEAPQAQKIEKARKHYITSDGRGISASV